MAKRMWIVLLVFLHAACPLFAANWYVDKDAAGANNGTSWANAWTSFAGIVWGGAGVVAGDTLYISGGSTGKTYTSTLTVGANGSSGNPITIKTGQEANHNGAVIFDFDEQGDSGAGPGIGISGRSYITISGHVAGERRLKIQNLRNTATRTSATAIGGQGITASNIVVEYVEVLNCNNGVRIGYPSSVTVRHSHFRVRGDAAVGLVSGTNDWDHHAIHDNTITLLQSTTGGPDGVQGTSGVSVYANEFIAETVTHVTSTQHMDMVSLTSNKNKIYGNRFTNIGDSQIHLEAWAQPGFSDILIYNNIFRVLTAIDPYPDVIRIVTDQVLTYLNRVKIYNNLFVDTNESGYNWSPVRVKTKTGATGSGNEFRNNIVYNCGSGAASFPLIEIDGPSDGWAFSNNIYYHPVASYVKVYGVAYTTANWINVYEPTAKNVPVSWVSYAPYSASNDFHLSDADTAAKNSGADLSATFSTDRDGAARSGAWDIGPYALAAGPAEPKGVRIITGARFGRAPDLQR